MSRKRTINRAQAIHPYGVGAIIDWGQECFVMKDTYQGGWSIDETITLDRLQRQLGVQNFRVPPTSKNNQSSIKLPIDRFPRWLFCPHCRKMKLWKRADENALSGDDLPSCSSSKCKKAILVPMRYVAACEDGHLTDIDWFKWAHVRKSPDSGNCDPQNPNLYFDADTSKGMSLNSLVIRCGNCGNTNSLDSIQAKGSLRSVGQYCKGSQPWEQIGTYRQCKKPLEALLRSQTAVHYSHVVSAIDLTVVRSPDDQEFDDKITEAVENLKMMDFATSLEDFMQDNIVSRIKNYLDHQLERDTDPSKIRDWILNSFVDSDEENYSTNPKDKHTIHAELLEEEWPALTTPTHNRGKNANLIVTSTDFPGEDHQLKSFFDDILLIERLREVRAFCGFNRVSTTGTLISPHLDEKRPWLPATEVFGEGIFFILSNARVEAWEAEHKTALTKRLEKAYSILSEGEGFSGFLAHEPILPRSILIHTMSHILMRQLCYECGYHASSIRERLYVSEERLGVLIYTADGDSEGSLGGLVRQGETQRITKTIRSSIERAAWCSNDPICSELPEHGVDGLNRAACHACSLVPETSCTHLNSMLDRKLLIETSQDSDIRGFFADIIE